LSVAAAGETIAHRCFPRLRQQAGNSDSGLAANNGAISGRPKSTTSNDANARRTISVW
jgi:hypothetical protein